MISLFIVLCLRLTVVQGTQVAIYKERTSGQCGDSGGGEGRITSAAACGAGALALGWGDTTAYTMSVSYYPPGCSFYSGTLYFNTENPNYTCASNEKCLCTLTCQPGTYQDQSGQSSCKSCPSDTYSIADAVSCPFDATSCPVGTYASGTATVCDLCAPGKYNDKQGQTACKSCDVNVGEYQNEEGKTSCDNNCVSPMVLTADARCIDNTVYKERTSGQCGASGGGWGKITSAAACGAGALALGWGDTTADTLSRSDFPPGCFFYGEKLNVNTENPDYDCRSNEKCLCTLTCQPGTYQDQSGQSSCKTCAIGTYSAVGASSCFALDSTTCRVGTHASGTATVCDLCAPGKYNDKQGQTACKSCATGEYQNDEGKTSCDNNCVSPMAITLDARCIDNTVNGASCPPGNYQDQSGQSSCKTCAIGTYSAVGASSCFALDSTTCRVGTYASGTSSICDACATGKYNDKQGQTSCTTCPDHSITDTGTATGASTCTPCAAGKYAQSGQSSCVSFCTEGSISSQPCFGYRSLANATASELKSAYANLHNELC